MKNLIILFTSIVLLSCNKHNTPIDSDPAQNISVSFQLVFENADGENLLHPETVGNYKHSEIKLYRDSLLTNEVLDTCIQYSNNIYFLNLFGGGSNEIVRGNDRIRYGTLYLQLNSSTVDTIYSETKYSGQSLLLYKVFYNSVLIHSIGESRAITVVKD